MIIVGNKLVNFQGQILQVILYFHSRKVDMAVWQVRVKTSSNVTKILILGRFKKCERDWRINFIGCKSAEGMQQS